MNNGHYSLPLPANEAILSYAPGTAERTKLKEVLKELKFTSLDVPMYIGSKEIRTNKKVAMRPPHQHKHILGYFNYGEAKHVKMAINAALEAKDAWEAMPWESRAAIFLKAADLIANRYRPYMNATTMLGQSKNVYQAEIDSACELIDFLRFNVYFLSEIYKQQPISSPGIHNQLTYRPLEGFVLAITPFNFTAIGANLPASAALCGNTVVWKPADTQVYSAQMFMRIMKEAGLPDGVINLIYVDGSTLGEVCFSHHQFAGIHFTGSTAVFNQIWKTIGENLSKYRSYPRIVGETGGKDFVMVHPSADADVTATALLRGAFEFQGQKCSAASRAYIPSNLASQVRKKLIAGVKSFNMGSSEDFSNFITAVIDEKSFNKIKVYIDKAKRSASVKLLAGGNCDKSVGYFIEPTILETTDPNYVTMREEIFGPVLTIYVYPEKKFSETLRLVDQTSPYALTGSIISQDRSAIVEATHVLRNAAGNFYVNDKPTGAVVGQQPFGGARGSGTNDKAGSMINLLRWLSPRTIKETYDAPKDYRYPFLEPEQ
jgi:1-pyrroline-5-carboxylate dehydrogenase